MFPWIARPLFVSLILSVGLLLGACSQVEVESEFESDGTARHSIEKVVIPSMWEEIFEDLDEFEDEASVEDETTQQERQALEEELDEQIDRDELAQEFDQVVLSAVDDRLEVDRIDEDDRIGVRVSIETEDGDDLGDALNTLYNAISLTEDEITAFSGSFTTISDEENDTTFQLDLTADGDALTHRAALMTGSDEDDDEDFAEQFLADLIEQGVEDESEEVDLREWFALTYTVSMPGELTDNDGTELDNGRVQFDLPFQDTQTYFIESRLGSEVEEVEDEDGFPTALIVGIAAGMLVLILIIAGAFYVLRTQDSESATDEEDS